MLFKSFKVESKAGSITGIGLLPVTTVLQKHKTTLQRQFRFRDNPHICEGYEIHMGETIATENASPLNQFTDAAGSDGYFLNDQCWGTYLHGILDNAIVVDSLLAPYTDTPGQIPDHRQYKEEQYDKLATLLRTHLDIDYIYKTLKS